MTYLSAPCLHLLQINYNKFKTCILLNGVKTGIPAFKIYHTRRMVIFKLYIETYMKYEC